MAISSNTKKDIFDEIKTRQIKCTGKLSEDDFFGRIIDLSTLPSSDGSYENMMGDFWQHRINNYDWEDYWYLADNRLNLVGNDELFKTFICELLHPLINDGKVSKELKKVFNFYLKKDGYQIVEDQQFYEPDLASYKIIEINPTQIEKSFKTSNEFVHEHYEKIDKRIRDEDYSGAITASRTLLEHAFKDIYHQITGDTFLVIDDLQIAFKKIQKLLKLDYNNKTNEHIKVLLRSYASIVNSLSFLANELGDRHATKSTAYRNSALLCIDSVKIFVNYLYSRMNNQFGIYPSIYEKLLKILDSDLRLAKKEDLLKDKQIKELLNVCDTYLIKLLLKKHINDYSVISFRSSDIFFAVLKLFDSDLVKQDLVEILSKNQLNGQICGLDHFLKTLCCSKPEIFDEKIKKLAKKTYYPVDL